MENKFPYTTNNKRYHTLTYFYEKNFNSKVAKVSLNAGFTCPNIDGSKGDGGCIYCSKLGSGDFAGDVLDDVITQYEKGMKVMKKKWPKAKFIAYFQAHTNTYASVDRLKELFEPFIKKDDCLGLAIATRSDCLSDEVINYLETINERCYLQVELGLQTIHDKTANFINRCSSLEEFDNAVKRLRKKNLNVVVHIINGLPYETEEMMLETAKYLNNLDIQGIKIHMLHILKNTPLEKIYNEKPFHVLTLDEYVDITVKQLRYLRSDIVIHRITGDPVADDLIEPKWLIKKFNVLNSIDKKMAKEDIYQGDLL